MKYSCIAIILLAFTVFTIGCKENQEARKPVSQASGSFMKKSIERNKRLVATEKQLIEAIIKSNPNIKYQQSSFGFWYTYVTKNTTDTLTPKKGDVAFFSYDLKDLEGNIVYTESELKPQVYSVDKQNIMTGLREGIKLMHKNEKITFLFPSTIAFGYHGDDKKIGPNQPLLCSVTLQNFMSEIVYNKQVLPGQMNQVQDSKSGRSSKIINSTKDTLTN